MNAESAVGLLKKHYKNWIKWSSIRALGETRAMKSVILVPLLGYLILFSRDLSELLVSFLHESSDPNVAINNTRDKIIAIYIGLLLISIGQILFFRCPNEIRKHSDSISYTNAMMNLPQIEMHRFVYNIFRYMFPNITEEKYLADGLRISKTDMDHGFFEDHLRFGFNRVLAPIKQALRGFAPNEVTLSTLYTRIAANNGQSKLLLFNWYEDRNEEHVITRNFIFWFYFTGFLPILYYSLRTVCSVLVFILF